MQTRTRTTGATAAPIANPYLEQRDCGIICLHNSKFYLINSIKSKINCNNNSTNTNPTRAKPHYLPK